MHQKPKGRRVLIVEENSFVPLDIRVWYEATTLRDNGWDVTVICPAPIGFPVETGLSVQEDASVNIKGVSVFYFPLYLAKGGVLGYLVEYLTAFFSIGRLCWHVWRQRHFDVLQICNPPDIFFPIALFYRFLGVGIIFDLHDLFPEFVSYRYPGWSGKLFYGVARVMEYLTHHSSHFTITVNQSYGKLANTRGHVSPEKLFIVRNGPKAREFTPVEPIPELKKGFPVMASYVGIMGYEDGIMEMIDSIRYVVIELGRRDILFTLIGDGAKRAQALHNVREWGLEKYVEMPGMVSDRLVIRQYLSSSDICLSPEPLTPLNARSTFIKVGEYMASGKPIVAYDLDETRWTANDAAIYVRNGDIQGFGCAVAMLADQSEQRSRMGEIGRERFLNVLSWEHQEGSLLRAYEMALNKNSK